MYPFLCPVCGKPLFASERSLRCANRHNYDRSSAGYVNLLNVNAKHSKFPGDDKGMAAARNRFLSGGHYAPLRNALIELALEHTNSENPLNILDSGCGEGYYTEGIFHALQEKQVPVTMGGIDISKFSLRWAAKREQAVTFAVASAYHLPVAEQSVDLLVNCFSPLALEEFQRVLKPGGRFFYVVPGPEHLWQLKQVLYERPYRNQEQVTPYEGFEYEDIRRVEYNLHLEDSQTICDLFQMTPYFWKTPRSGTERLQTLTELDTRIEFAIHVFRRK